MSLQVAQKPLESMTSVELVAVINEMREEGTAVLRHDTFLVKVRKVLGSGGLQKFQDSYLNAQGKEQPCYNLPQREANLMVMSESYKVQAAVYDRMIKLETAFVAPPQPTAPLRISVRYIDGLPLHQHDEMTEVIEAIANLSRDADKAHNAILYHFRKHFRGTQRLDFDLVLSYLREERARYASGYEPYYKGGIVQFEPVW